MRHDARGGGGVRRRLSKFAARASLLLFLALGSIGVRSIWYDDSWVLPTPDYSRVTTRDGTVYISWVDNWSHPQTPPGVIRRFAGVEWHDSWIYVSSSYHRRRTTVSYSSGSGMIVPGKTFSFPIWPLIALASLWPAMVVVQRVRMAKQFRPGHCPTCGYDLRATPHRCPECGTTLGVTA
jgi:hypothetical protein